MSCPLRRYADIVYRLDYGNSNPESGVDDIRHGSWIATKRQNGTVQRHGVSPRDPATRRKRRRSGGWIATPAGRRSTQCSPPCVHVERPLSTRSRPGEGPRLREID